MTTRLLIRGGILVSMAAGAVPAAADLLIEGGQVAAVLPPGVPVLVDHDIVDATGMCVLPGLIDVHDHIALKGRNWVGRVEEYDAEQRRLFQLDEPDLFEECRRNGQRLLQAGITTVRDFGVDFGASARYCQLVAAAAERGPRLVTCGTPLCVPGGHLHQRALEVSSVDDINGAVAQAADSGAQWVKVFASGGPASFPDRPIEPEFTAEQLANVVRAARRRDLKVAAHALPLEAVANAIRAGVDTIEHGVFLNEEAARAMASEGIALVPTCSGYATRRAILVATGAVELARMYETHILDQHARSVRMARDAGVRIGVGTDITADVVDEMQALASILDWTPLDAIEAATSVAGGILQLDDGCGIVREGHRADLVIADQAVLHSTEQLRIPRAVFAGGVMTEGARLPRGVGHLAGSS